MYVHAYVCMYVCMYVQVFPVEEARVVQDFLDQVKEDEQDGGGESWDDLSSEELLERLERLENLQKLKTSNEDKVQTIDQSARSEDVQRALEKNPDISKERSNLLQVLESPLTASRWILIR